jgi:hypothetical protein
MSTNLRSEAEILADLDTVNEVLDNIRPDVSPDNLNRVRRRLECELAAARIARRTANLNPRFASLFASSPLTRPVLAAADYGDPQDMSLEGPPGYPSPEPNSDREYREYELKQDAERDRRAAREEACQE